MEQTFGVDFEKPLAHLREYIQIARALLQQGSVDFAGQYYQAHTSISSPVDVPVMAAALGPRAYRICGAEADGAISWVCPGSYLNEVALPAMQRGAERADRPVPPLIVQVPVCVHENPEEAREAVRQQFAGFARSPFYQNMFTTAGFPEVSQGTWSDGMVDAVAVWGDESRVTEGLNGLFALGATEILASPVPAGGDRDASRDCTLQVLANVAKSFDG